jgi:alpha-glucosidase
MTTVQPHLAPPADGVASRPQRPRRPLGGLTTPGEVVGNTIDLVRRAARRPAPVIVGVLGAAPVQRDTTWNVGAFRVTWSTAGTPDDPSDDRIEIRDATGRVVLASRAGAAFLTSDGGTERIAESRGMFHLAFERHSTSSTQHVDTVEQLPDATLRLRGRLTGGASAGGVDGVAWTMQLRADADGSLGIDVSRDPVAELIERSSSPRSRLQLTFAREPRERFFGMGEQFTHVEATGRRIDVLNGEHGIGRGLQPVTTLADALAGAGGTPTSSYAAMPVLLTTARRLLYLDNAEPTAVDLRDPRSITLEASSDSMRARLITAPTPAGLVQAYTARVGRMPELPEWITSGAIVGLQGGTEAVRRRVDELRAAGTSIAAVWLQDWQGQRTTSAGKQLWWNWELDRERYPGWEQLRGEWQRDGMRVMTYVNPFLVDVASRPGAQRNLYAEAVERGYLVERSDGSPYLVRNTDFSAGLVDLTNPAAREWMRDVLVRQVIGAGASGWMADYG